MPAHPVRTCKHERPRIPHAQAARRYRCRRAAFACMASFRSLKPVLLNFGSTTRQNFADSRSFVELCYRFRLAAFDPLGLDDPDPSSPGGLMPVRPTAPARFARRLQAGASLCSRILVHQWLIGFPRSDELQPQIVLSPLERGVGVEANPKVPGDSVQCAMKRELI